MDAFIAAIIKALPDAIATAIVTVLLTGGILFVFQKQIESLFARQMEKFRAKLQYENFEQQTKFSRTYQNRVETLANLYQRFIIYKTDFNHMVHEASQLGHSPESISTTVSAMIMENRGKYEEFRMYFENNRLYLPDNISTAIRDLLLRHDLMYLAIHMFSDDRPESFIKVGNSAIKALGFEVNVESDFERPEFLSLIWQMDKEVYTQAERLERLYKSVAEAQ
jgi:hypothetical protein